MEEKTNAKGFMLGLLAGSVIGGITALLYAPKSGKALRGDITTKRKELTKGAEDYLVAAKDKATEIVSDGRKKAGEFYGEAKRKAGSISNGAEKLYLQGKELVTDEAGKLKNAVKAGVDSYREDRTATDLTATEHMPTDRSVTERTATERKNVRH